MVFPIVVLKIVRMTLSLACLAGFVWFGMRVPLGEHTLFDHMMLIGKSKESQDLYRGTKDRVTGLFEGSKGAKGGAGGSRGTDRPGAPPPKVEPAEAAPPQEKLSDGDRDDMRRLIESQRTKIAKHKK